MNLSNAALITAVGAPLYDWSSVTGSAALMTSFEYRYWPPSRVRLVGFCVLTLGLFVTLLLMKPPEPDSRMWVIVPGVVGLSTHGATSIVDIFGQRRRARRG